jgi:ABC-type transport system involved in multi-copper enzyme maturation permease subunit
MVLTISGIGIIAGAALLVGGAAGVIASLLIETVVLLVTVPLTLLIVLGIARATGTYFGTLGQAVVRLASFLGP